MLDWRGPGSLSHLPRRSMCLERRGRTESQSTEERLAGSALPGRTFAPSPQVSERAQCDCFSPLERSGLCLCFCLFCHVAQLLSPSQVLPLPQPSCVCFSILLCGMGGGAVPGAPADPRRESWLQWSMRGELGKLIQVDTKDRSSAQSCGCQEFSWPHPGSPSGYLTWAKT